MPQKPQRSWDAVIPDGEGETVAPLVFPPQMDQELEAQIAEGQKILEQAAEITAELNGSSPTPSDLDALRDKFHSWNEYNEKLLRIRFTSGTLADSYRLLRGFDIEARTPQAEFDLLRRDINTQLRRLGRIRQDLDKYKSVVVYPTDMVYLTEDGSVSPRIGDKIFIVHGHDGDTKLQVAGFVERITGERPVILHEQADSGRTIIEKFEEHASDAGFAIVLLTADDLGKAKGATRLSPRARQNVVLEFGYFMAKLGRGRVVALHEAGVELPSDVTGVLYKSLAGNWHTELARELKAADIEVDFSKAL